MARRLTFVLFLLALSVPIALLADFSESSAALNDIRKNVRVETLDNGLRVIMYRRGDAPIFAGVVGVRAGGTDEALGETGISHMLEHMAFKGTPEIGTLDYSREKVLLARLEELALVTDAGNKFTEQQRTEWVSINAELETLWEGEELTKAFELRGAEGLNATTSKDATNYMTNLPRTAFEFWCWMESERLLNPVMRQFYQERDVVMEERRMRYDDSPQGKLYELLLGTAYTVHPYRAPVIGYDFDITRLTGSELTRFHRKFYVPSNMAISVVGDINYEDDFKTIKKYFGRIPAGPNPPRPTIVEPDQKGERVVTFETAAQPQIGIAYRKPNYPHPDDPAIGVMQEILAGGRLSPLYRELVEKRKIASSIDAHEAPGDAYPNLMIFWGVVKPPFGNDDLLKHFDQLIEDFKKRLPTEQEMTIAKRSLSMVYMRELRANMTLARDFVHSELLFDEGWPASFNWYEKAMAVTPQDVQRVAKRYLVAHARTIGRVEPEGLMARK